MGLNKNMMGGGSIFRKSSPYPQCKIFNCPKARYVTNMCCFFCEKKSNCSDPCLNDPTVCKMCVLPTGSDKVYDLGSLDLPDAPDIARAERTGLQPGEKVPFEDDTAECPICGKTCDSLYLDVDGDLFGCDMCVRLVDAGEYQRKKREEEKE